MTFPSNLSPRAKIALVAVLDAACVAASYFFALLLRFDFTYSSIDAPYIAGYRMLVIPLVIIAIATFWALRLYHVIWSYVSISEFATLVLAWLIISALGVGLDFVVGTHMPISFWIAGGFVGLASTTTLRLSFRILRSITAPRISDASPNAQPTAVMLIGAGDAGHELLREVRRNPELGLEVRCIIDDNRGKHGRFIEGVPIVGAREDIPQVATDYDIDQIVIAMPSASGKDRKAILEMCQATGLPVRTVPGIYQFIDGELTFSALREVNLEDLLGRDPAHVDPVGIDELVRGRSVLVTGGGGSIGSELCRQVAKHGPARLTIFDIYENNAYDIQQELLRNDPILPLQVLIGSVRDETRVEEVFAACAPDVVFHAAAHKHVPLMEVSPREAVKNNVAGTWNVARAALAHGTSRFVLISTDKAVNPTNVMGATKRLCEMEVQHLARRAATKGSRTTFSAVRFGNVLGSNGSVVPLFEKQIAEGGPVTVTDPRITRFFMTIPEAVSLVLQSACYASGGEIFVLDMGEPVLIDNMARNLIRLSGHEPGVDIEIEYTGLRPGEKLYEEVLMDEEGLGETPNRQIRVARPIEMDDAAFPATVERLCDAARAGNDEEIRSLVHEAVPTYHPERGGKGARPAEDHPATSTDHTSATLVQ